MTRPNLQLFATLVLCLFLCISSGRYCYAQGDIYASYVRDSSSDFRSAHKLADNNRTNYAYISTAIGVLATSTIRVGFPVSAQAGDVVSITVQGTGQLLGLGLLNGVTIRLYDSLGTLVATGNGGSLLQLALLSPADNIHAIRFLTNPTGNYRFKEARIDFNNVLSVNLLNELRVYDISYQQHCPETLADGPVQAGTATSPSLLQGYVTNAGNVSDANADNYATLTVPLNILSILPPAYLDVAFNKPAKAGEFVGFTVSQASAVLGLALLQNITITAYDANGAVIVGRSGNLLNLKLLTGASNRYMLGFVTPPGNYNLSRLRITLTGVLNLFQDINVYNAFHYRIVKPPVTVITSGSTNICSEGSVTLTAVDSIGGGSFLWSTGATTPSITVSQPGAYTVQIIDETGCSRSSVPVVITTLPDVALTATISNTKCNNTGDGSISLTNAPAGTYTYQWSNGQTSEDINGLIPGIYTLTITNTANSCVYNRVYSVVSDNNLSIKTAVVNTSDKQKSDGRIVVSVDGGSGNYRYDWSNGANTTELSALSAGIYYVTVTDMTTGCLLSDTIIVNDGSGGNGSLTLTADITNASNCNEASGSATVRVSGGSGNYSYLWSTGAATAKAERLKAGNYYVLVTDNQNGQKQGLAVAIGNTGLPEITEIITPTNCNVSSGSIQLNTTGGSGSYTYRWNTGATTASLTGLAAGIYIVTVTDGTTGCMVQEIYAVTAQNGPVATFEITRPDPFRDISGSIVVNANGNYAYMWSNGSTERDQKDLLPGMYTLKITDNATGCSSAYMFDLSMGATLYITASPLSNTECENAYNGGIKLVVSGGIAPYTYLWSNGSNMQNLANIGPGEYTVTVTDATGSMNKLTIPVISADIVNTLDCNSDGSDFVIHNVLTPNGDGVNDVWLISSITRYPNNNVMVFDKWGDMVFEQKGYDNQWRGTDKNNNLLPAGTYYYLLKLNQTENKNIKSEYTGFITVKR